ERAETLEYFKTLGSFSLGSFGLFVGLTSGAGLDDVAAGNLVLVALCAYGVYLLFFDGGITQAALEQQAIQQLAEEEGEIMSGAPRANIVPFDLSSSQPQGAIDVLQTEGYTRVNRVISESVAEGMLAYVNQALVEKREEVASGATVESMSFGDVLMRENRE
ncbi:MAG: hypothetical protein SGPRY_008719, partial [Prymnesium sp.]